MVFILLLSRRSSVPLTVAVKRIGTGMKTGAVTIPVQPLVLWDHTDVRFPHPFAVFQHLTVINRTPPSEILSTLFKTLIRPFSFRHA